MRARKRAMLLKEKNKILEKLLRKLRRELRYILYHPNNSHSILISSRIDLINKVFSQQQTPIKAPTKTKKIFPYGEVEVVDVKKLRKDYKYKFPRLKKIKEQSK